MRRTRNCSVGIDCILLPLEKSLPQFGGSDEDFVACCYDVIRSRDYFWVTIFVVDRNDFTIFVKVFLDLEHL